MKTSSIDYVILGNGIHHFRQKTGISSLEAAKALDLSVEQYNQIERGERRPSLDVLINICCLFHTLPDDLLRECLEDYAVKRNTAK